MYCKHCGAELRDDAKFCGKCGTEVTLRVAYRREEVNAFEAEEKIPERKTIADIVKSSEAVKDTILEKKEQAVEHLNSSEATQKFNARLEESATANDGSPGAFFYIVDFFKKLFQKKNASILIYLFINLIIITVAVYYMMGGPETGNPITAFLVALLVYGLSLTIALSPIGEWVLRIQAGGRKIKRQEQLDYLMPIFEEVYAKAKAEDPAIPDNVKLYISDEECMNAAATGRKSIVVAHGLLELKPEKIAGVLAHEFGHLSHHDTDPLLLVHVGNWIIMVGVFGLRIAISVAHMFVNLISLLTGGAEGAVVMLVAAFYRVMAEIAWTVFYFLWTKLGDLLVKRTMRNNEFAADQFACDLGYGYQLCQVLDLVREGGGTKGFIAALTSDHPDNDIRIAKMQEYGVNYSAASMYGQI